MLAAVAVKVDGSNPVEIVKVSLLNWLFTKCYYKENMLELIMTPLFFINTKRFYRTARDWKRLEASLNWASTGNAAHE